MLSPETRASPNYPRASKIGWTHARHCPFLNNDNNELYLTREHLQQSVLPGVSDTNKYIRVICRLGGPYGEKL